MRDEEMVDPIKVLDSAFFRILDSDEDEMTMVEALKVVGDAEKYLRDVE